MKSPPHIPQVTGPAASTGSAIWMRRPQPQRAATPLLLSARPPRGLRAPPGHQRGSQVLELGRVHRGGGVGHRRTAPPERGGLVDGQAELFG
jgi:hypothetical protein